MHAVILAGGKGTRLRPFTKVLPKPLMPIGDMPILEIVLRQLRCNGFDEITVAVGYLRELLQAFLGTGERFGLNIRYSFEDKPLGTAGPLKLIDNLPSTFLMMNGDILTDFNYKKFMEAHRESKSIMTIGCYERTVKIDFGVIDANKENVVVNYSEKPVLNYNVSMGIYAFNSSVLKYVPQNEYFDLPDLVKLLIKAGERISAFPFKGYWLDIGRPDDYEIAVEKFEAEGLKYFGINE
jgi:NDP-mannose synthase